MSKSKPVSFTGAPKPGPVVLVHWHDDEAKALAKDLEAVGVKDVHVGLPEKMSEVRALNPKAVVVSLRRLPSHGREVVDALWSTKWGREIPVVFFDGDADKVAKLREQFPAAKFVAFGQVVDNLV